MPEAATAPVPTDEELLQQFLSGRDVNCPGCQYNLRDLTGQRCPECGQEIILHLRLAEPRQAALLMGLIGLSAGAGLNGLLLVYWVLMRLFMPFGPPADAFLLIITIGFLIHGAGVAAWLRFWPRIRILNAAPRWTLATACCLLPLIDIVVFTFNIR